jgi:hypothetical protein
LTVISKANLDQRGLTIDLKVGTMGPSKPIALMLCVAPDSKTFTPFTYDGVKVTSATLAFMDKGISCPIVFSAMQLGLTDPRTGKKFPRPQNTLDLNLLATKRGTRYFIDIKQLSTEARTVAKQQRLVAVAAFVVLNSETLEVDCCPITLDAKNPP